MSLTATARRALRALLIGFLVSLCAACAAERTEHGDRAVLQVPMGSPARALVIGVTGSPNAYALGAVPAVERALAAAGFQVTAPRAPHDAIVAVDVARGVARVAGGFLVVRGESAGRLRLTFAGPSYPIETLSVDFVMTERWIDPEAVDQLVDTLVRSPRVHQFAAATLQARELAARREAERLAAERRAEEERQRLARAAEAAAWETANTAACAAPTALDACDGVRAYLARYPEGWRSGEARDLLQKSEEPLKALRDDAAWAKVDEAQCTKPKNEDDCDPVNKYLEVYPEGRHAARAQELTRKAAPKLKLLRVLREAREAQAARAAAAAAAASNDGDSEWSGGASSGRNLHGGGPVYVRGYTRKNGTYVRPHTRRR